MAREGDEEGVRVSELSVLERVLMEGKRLRWCKIDHTHKLLLRMRRRNVVGSSCGRAYNFSFCLSLIS